MKVSGKGILLIIIFLVVIPVLLEVVLLFVLPKNGSGSFSMAILFFKSYVKLIPIYLVYLVIAFAITYLIKNWRKNTNQG